ncbi:hypothetical protein CDL12_14486 [Handroanthus impetiginosus]|uniref:DUF7866 domain-containing protein n=1 Tax=Handroanthus impetiginosus TaxID=429701 RepID=A0A2G9H5Z5_9LAMI|nr:hypothetical protein CDL12_14486 [Handroanthus impetiginosus]
MRAICSGMVWSVFLVLFICCLHQVRFSFANGNEWAAARNATSMEEMVPLVEPGKWDVRLMVNESRRKLGSFQICALCTCCGGGSKSYCLASPCCYAINCNIPNRPFGYCSFTPKTCNCFGCHI